MHVSIIVKDPINPNPKAQTFIGILMKNERMNLMISFLTAFLTGFDNLGHDTTSTTLSWTLYEIGLCPTIQQKLYDEIMEAKSNHSSLPDQIRSLKYMECVVKESLRLHPPVGGIGRELQRDSIVNNQMFPKGKFLHFLETILFILHASNFHVLSASTI